MIDVGDEVIKEVGGRLLSMAPEGATVSRLGGDEFAVLLPDVDLALAALGGGAGPVEVSHGSP